MLLEHEQVKELFWGVAVLGEPLHEALSRIKDGPGRNVYVIVACMVIHVVLLLSWAGHYHTNRTAKKFTPQGVENDLTREGNHDHLRKRADPRQ